MDTLKYPGFTGRHFILDAKLYPALFLTYLIVIRSFSFSWFSKINFFILTVSTLSYFSLSYLEATNYINYILANYKINLEGFVYIPVSSFLLLVALNKEIKGLINFKPRFSRMILTFFAIYTLFVNLGKTVNKAVYENLYILTHFKGSYDDKMRYQWGNFYDYMVFVKENTPTDSTIVIPPKIPPWWNRSGDFRLVKAFLYPRKLVQYDKEEIPDIESLPKGTYILIAWGEWRCDIEGMCRGWPIQKIKVSEIIVKKENSTGIKEVRENVIYNPSDTPNPYGLLKI